MLTLSKRKKTNFMIDIRVLQDLKMYVPEGDRSNFINDNLEHAIKIFKRKKASEEMDKMREELNIKLSTEEIIKLKNYGRDS